MTEKTNFRGVLVASDGVLDKKVAWFHKNKAGLYTGTFNMGVQHHMSYHTDGKKHQIFGTKRTPWEFGQRLDRFLGWEILFFSTLNKSSIPGEPYEKKKKIDKVVSFNIHEYPHKEINMIWTLFEDGKKDLLKNVTSSWPRGTTFLFDQINPWLVIHLVEDEKPLMEFDGGKVKVSGMLNEKGKEYRWIAIGE